MERFLKDSDYSVLIRNEIKELLEEENPTDIYIAESMALAQMKNYLSGRYDTTQIFATSGERNMHIVMLAIDLTLYHLYTSEAPNMIPEHRSDRYADALSWLKDISRGKVTADLPLLKDEGGDEQMDFRLSSRKPKNHKY